jgi:hypothetical protein
MDAADHSGDENGYDDGYTRPRQLPDDLPRSLDDRKSFPGYRSETEVYDAWQGEQHFFRIYLTALTERYRSITISDDTGSGATAQFQSFPG